MVEAGFISARCDLRRGKEDWSGIKPFEGCKEHGFDRVHHGENW